MILIFFLVAMVVIIISIILVNIDDTYDKAFFYLDIDNDDLEKDALEAILSRHDPTILLCSFPDVPSTDEMTSKLEYAYEKGCRKMFGFLRTATLMNTLDFAESHPDVKIYSAGSTASFLENKPSNIFRYVLTNDNAERTMLEYFRMKEFTNLAIVYDENEPFCSDLYTGLKDKALEYLGLTTINIPITPGTSDISALNPLVNLPRTTLVAVFAFSAEFIEFVEPCIPFFTEHGFSIIGGDSIDDLAYVASDSLLESLVNLVVYEVQSGRLQYSYNESNGRFLTGAALDILDYLNGTLIGITHGATLEFDEHGDRKYGLSNIRRLTLNRTTEPIFMYEEGEEFPGFHTASLMKTWN
jgi:hypothetical protein